MEQPNQDYYLRIIKQPAKEVRYRYGKEKRNSAERPLASSDGKKIFPVLTSNYKGKFRIVVVLVDKDKRPHPHSLVGPCCAKGICVFESEVTEETPYIEFKHNVGIQCARKSDITNEMKARRKLAYGDPFNRGYDSIANSDIDLHEVRLAVIALVIDASGCWSPLQAIATDIIRDSKASKKLIITNKSDCHGPVYGATQLILLTETVFDTSTVKVLFFNAGWQAYAQTVKIHKSVAFVIMVPAYHDVKIKQNVLVNFVLTRKSDFEEQSGQPYDPSMDPTRSEIHTFEYLREYDGDYDTKPIVEVPPLQNANEYNIEDIFELLQDHGPPPQRFVGQPSMFTQQLPMSLSFVEQEPLFDEASSLTELQSSMIQSCPNEQQFPNRLSMDNSFFTGPSTTTAQQSSMIQSSANGQQFPIRLSMDNSCFTGPSTSTARQSSMIQSSSNEQQFPNRLSMDNSFFTGPSTTTAQQSSMDPLSWDEQMHPMEQSLFNKPTSSMTSAKQPPCIRQPSPVLHDSYSMTSHSSIGQFCHKFCDNVDFYKKSVSIQTLF